ncbi:MAG: hypothetical protein ACE5R6_05895 [Candidatus Heimdallarchaeota archaeon]
MTTDKERTSPKRRKGGIGRALKDIFYGLAVHDMVRYMLKVKMNLDHLFMVLMMGETMGVPILPPYYTLRLMPYVVPYIPVWKRRMLKERDLTDMFY